MNIFNSTICSLTLALTFVTQQSFASPFFTFRSNTSVSSITSTLYDAPELLARANVNDGFNLPPMSYINNTTPVINDRGDVAFKVLSIESTQTQGVWGKLKTDPAGKIFVTAPDERFVTDPDLNNKGDIVYSLYDEGVTDGVFVFNLETLEETQLIDPSRFQIAYYTYPQILDNGTIYFRGTNEKNDRTVYKFLNNQLTSLFSEGQSVQTNNTKLPASYLFRPIFNQKGAMAIKMRFGKRYDWGEDLVDAIVLVGEDNKPVVKALDLDGDELSQFKGLSNTVSLNNLSQMAFIGFLADGKKGIYRANETDVQRVAFEGDTQISEIEYFMPKIIDNGDIYFRAKDHDGKRGIYLYTNDVVVRLIGEDDVVDTDLGAAKILWNKFYPGLSGDIDVNQNGDVVFHALLVSKDENREIGAGIFQILRKKANNENED
ncbi:MAG: hypothetical protein L6Q33_07685 [Bacteriovoracaceae bacterium]|nr:hypothetical protein [Bacteriovoracaceae bacterium]